MLLLGKFADRMNPRVLIPGTLVWQIIVMMLYLLIEDPASWPCYVLAIF